MKVKNMFKNRGLIRIIALIVIMPFLCQNAALSNNDYFSSSKLASRTIFSGLKTKGQIYGELLKLFDPNKIRVCILNKPKGFVSAHADSAGGKSCYYLLPEWARNNREGFYIAKGIDDSAEGLMIFINNRLLADMLGNLENEMEEIIGQFGNLEPGKARELDRKGIEELLAALSRSCNILSEKVPAVEILKHLSGNITGDDNRLKDVLNKLIQDGEERLIEIMGAESVHIWDLLVDKQILSIDSDFSKRFWLKIVKEYPGDEIELDKCSLGENYKRPVAFQKGDKKIVLLPHILYGLKRMSEISRKLDVEMPAKIYIRNGIAEDILYVPCENKIAIVYADPGKTDFLNDSKYLSKTEYQMGRLAEFAREILTKGADEIMIKECLSFLIKHSMDEYGVSVSIYSLSKKERYTIDSEYCRNLMKGTFSKEFLEDVANIGYAGTKCFCVDSVSPYMFEFKKWRGLNKSVEAGGGEWLDAHRHPTDCPSPPSVKSSRDIYSYGFFEGRLNGLILSNGDDDVLFIMHETDKQNKEEYIKIYHKFWSARRKGEEISILDDLRNIAMVPHQILGRLKNPDNDNGLGNRIKQTIGQKKEERPPGKSPAEVFRIFCEREPLKSEQIAKELNMDVSIVTNYLKELINLGLVTKRGGGEDDDEYSVIPLNRKGKAEIQGILDEEYRTVLKADFDKVYRRVIKVVLASPVNNVSIEIDEDKEGDIGYFREYLNQFRQISAKLYKNLEKAFQKDIIRRPVIIEIKGGKASIEFFIQPEFGTIDVYESGGRRGHSKSYHDLFGSDFDIKEYFKARKSIPISKLKVFNNGCTLNLINFIYEKICDTEVMEKEDIEKFLNKNQIRLWFNLCEEEGEFGIKDGEVKLHAYKDNELTISINLVKGPDGNYNNRWIRSSTFDLLGVIQEDKLDHHWHIHRGIIGVYDNISIGDLLNNVWKDGPDKTSTVITEAKKDDGYYLSIFKPRDQKKLNRLLRRLNRFKDNLAGFNGNMEDIISRYFYRLNIRIKKPGSKRAFGKRKVGGKSFSRGSGHSGVKEGKIHNLGSENSYNDRTHEDMREFLKDAKQIQVWGRPVAGAEYSKKYRNMLGRLFRDLVPEANIILVKHNKRPPWKIRSENTRKWSKIWEYFLFADPEDGRWVFSHSGTRKGAGRYIYLTEKAFLELINTKNVHSDENRQFLKDLMIYEFSGNLGKISGSEDVLRNYVHNNFVESENKKMTSLKPFDPMAALRTIERHFSDKECFTLQDYQNKLDNEPEFKDAGKSHDGHIVNNEYAAKSLEKLEDCCYIERIITNRNLNLYRYLPPEERVEKIIKRIRKEGSYSGRVKKLNMLKEICLNPEAQSNITKKIALFLLSIIDINNIYYPLNVKMHVLSVIKEILDYGIAEELDFLKFNLSAFFENEKLWNVKGRELLLDEILIGEGLKGKKGLEDMRIFLKRSDQVQIWGERAEGIEHNEVYSNRLKELLPELDKEFKVILVRHKDKTSWIEGESSELQEIWEYFLFMDPKKGQWVFSYSGSGENTGRFIYLTEKAFLELIETKSGKRKDNKEFLKKLINYGSFQFTEIEKGAVSKSDRAEPVEESSLIEIAENILIYKEIINADGVFKDVLRRIKSHKDLIGDRLSGLRDLIFEGSDSKRRVLSKDYLISLAERMAGKLSKYIEINLDNRHEIDNFFDIKAKITLFAIWACKGDLRKTSFFLGIKEKELEAFIKRRRFEGKTYMEIKDNESMLIRAMSGIPVNIRKITSFRRTDGRASVYPRENFLKSYVDEYFIKGLYKTQERSYDRDIALMVIKKYFADGRGFTIDRYIEALEKEMELQNIVLTQKTEKIRDMAEKLFEELQRQKVIFKDKSISRNRYFYLEEARKSVVSIKAGLFSYKRDSRGRIKKSELVKIVQTSGLGAVIREDESNYYILSIGSFVGIDPYTGVENAETEITLWDGSKAKGDLITPPWTRYYMPNLCLFRIAKSKIPDVDINCIKLEEQAEASTAAVLVGILENKAFPCKELNRMPQTDFAFHQEGMRLRTRAGDDFMGAPVIRNGKFAGIFLGSLPDGKLYAISVDSVKEFLGRALDDKCLVCRIESECIDPISGNTLIMNEKGDLIRIEDKHGNIIGKYSYKYSHNNEGEFKGLKLLNIMDGSSLIKLKVDTVQEKSGLKYIIIHTDSIDGETIEDETAFVKIELPYKIVEFQPIGDESGQLYKRYNNKGIEETVLNWIMTWAAWNGERISASDAACEQTRRIYNEYFYSGEDLGSGIDPLPIFIVVWIDGTIRHYQGGRRVRTLNNNKYLEKVFTEIIEKYFSDANWFTLREFFSVLDNDPRYKKNPRRDNGHLVNNNTARKILRILKEKGCLEIKTIRQEGYDECQYRYISPQDNIEIIHEPDPEGQLAASV